jgi:hypothetical protein
MQARPSRDARMSFLQRHIARAADYRMMLCAADNGSNSSSTTANGVDAAKESGMLHGPRAAGASGAHGRFAR